MASGEVKLEKLAFVDKWKTVKALAGKNMKRQIDDRRKDGEGNEEELARVTADEKDFKQHYVNFELGLTPTLEALENAKTSEEQAKYCKDGVRIIGLYDRLIDKFIDRHETAR